MKFKGETDSWQRAETEIFRQRQPWVRAYVLLCPKYAYQGLEWIFNNSNVIKRRAGAGGGGSGFF